MNINPVNRFLLDDKKYKYGTTILHFSLLPQAWLELMDEAEEEDNESRIICNREAQHRYLAWRAEKVINVLHHVSSVSFFFNSYWMKLIEF